MKILFVTDQFPYPLDSGGNVRTYHVLKALCSLGTVTLLSHHAACEIGEFVKSIGGHGVRVIQVKRDGVLKRVLRGLMHYGVRGIPLFLVRNYHRALLYGALNELRSGDYDVVHFNHIDTAIAALDHNIDAAKVLDTHNCLTQFALDASREEKNALRRRILRREARLLESMESRTCNKMDSVWVCSIEEKNFLKSISVKSDIWVVPNGVDVDFYRSSGRYSEEPGAIAFTGSMAYFPNADAVEFFCRKVMPLVSDIIPQVQFYAVGKAPPHRVSVLHDGVRVFVTGTVDDVRPYLEKAQIVVVPLNYGGGTRLKILEAFAMGKAVVSTPKGAEGIPASDGKEIMIAGDEVEFAKTIRQLLVSKALRSDLGDAAKTFVLGRYRWSVIQDEIRQAYDRVLSTRGRL